MRRRLLAVSLLGVLFMFGCRRPYDVPEYELIENNETAFVIPLEGETSKQASLQSEQYLKSMQVATKRIRIPHRWNQTGRPWKRWAGKWIATVRVLKVNRAPVTRQWTTSTSTGTARTDQGIWVESKDSVGFSTGFSCTAYIEEPNAALYLYKYPASSLADVMDEEIRARIQTVAAETCALYDLDDLRGKKGEIIKAIRDDVFPFFKARGITVSTIGMFGGFAYENPKVQEAIDEVFRSQQLEDVAEAKRKAALKDKDATIIAAEAQREAIKLVAEAEAEKIRLVNKAAEEAQKNPLFYKLKQLEVEINRIQKWDGMYPRWYMGNGMSGTSPGLLLSVDTSK